METFTSYIRDTNRDLYEVAENTEVFDLVKRSQKLKGGFTFLMPNADYTKKIKELYDEDDESAFEMLKNLIVCSYLPSPSDWNTDELSNLHNKKIDTVNIGNKEITLAGKGSAVISVDRKFANKAAGIAIYKVTSGFVSKGTTKAKKVKVEKRPKIVGYRRSLFAHVMEQNDIYTECLHLVVSFLKHLSKTDTDTYEALVPLLDYCPVTTFIILFEPLKGAHHFVDDATIDGWYPNYSHVKNPRSAYLKVLESVKKTPPSAHYKAVVQQIRNELQELVNLVDIIKLTHESYKELTTLNQLSGDIAVRDVLPLRTFTYLKSKYVNGHNIKLVQDEIRMAIRVALEEGDSWKTVFEDVCREHNLYPQLMDTTNTSTMTKQALLMALASFIDTTNFHYLLPPKIGAYGGKSGNCIDVDPSKETEDLADLVIDPTKYKADILSSVKDKKTSVDDVEESIRSLIETGEHIPDSLIQSMRSLCEER